MRRGILGATLVLALASAPGAWAQEPEPEADPTLVAPAVEADADADAEAADAAGTEFGNVPDSNSEELIDGIAAQVGTEIVLISDVRNLSGPMEMRVRQAGGRDTDIAQLRADALERLIERALVQQVIQRSELEATEIEVDTAIGAIASENNITIAQLVATVEAEGLPFEVYRERIRGEIEQSKVVNGMVASRVTVEESEVRELYNEKYQDQPTGGDEVHLAHLLVPFTADGPAARRAACADATRARTMLTAGETLDLVASELPEQARAVDLGWIHDAALASWMAEEVRGLAPGGATRVIETEFGCNVLQLVERRTFTKREFDDVKNQLYDELFAVRMQEEYVEFMEKLRKQTYIERKGFFAEAARLGSENNAAATAPGP
ncbi:MAG: SurA N-terminal domain-containing protein [Myxococcota bacterium]